MLYIVLLLLVIVCEFASQYFISLLFGCARKFKNGRKCSMWSCPNQKECPFSKYYDGGD